MERRGESVEARGRTIEEAVENGLAEIGLRRDQVEIEVLSRGSRGVLGLGAEDARVRLTPKRAPAATLATQLPAAAEEEEEEEELEEPEEEEEGRAEPASQQVQDIARDALAGLLSRMSINARVVIKAPSGLLAQESSPPVVLDVQGEDLGVLIGRRGETLSALQYLVRLMVNHKTHKWINVVVDVEGYKERRERQLRQLAERMAERVVATQKSVVLEAMPAYERRIVHLTLRDHPQVTTHSIGEDENRKVMILLRS
jgi:spoIIIJ-associated protein